MLSAGGQVPTTTEAPASASDLAIAKPNPPSSATPATSARRPVRSILSMLKDMSQSQSGGKGNDESGAKRVTAVRKAWTCSLACAMYAVTASAQTADTLSTERPLLTGADAALVAGFTAAAIAAAPADKYFTRQLQDPARQANRVFRGGATVFRIWGNPGALIAGAGIYLVGTARSNRRVQDLGLHTVESVVLANIVSGTIKVTAGRARPRVDTTNAANFQLMRGFRSDDYRSFPSGHSTAAFAFAALVSAETGHWWPDARWIVGPAAYGVAALSGVSRIYNNQHWASDVITGAAIGTLTGIKVFRYQHSHPGNRLDNLLLKAGVQSSGGHWNILFAAGSR